MPWRGAYRRLAAGGFAFVGVWGWLPAAAGDERPITFRIEPAYTVCVAGASCGQAAVVSFDIFGGLAKTASHAVRLKIGRDYETRRDEDAASDEIDVTRGAWRGARDVFDLRLRGYDEAGALATSWHAGETYERSATTPYHAIYLSFDPYFGRRIARGTDGAAHQYDVQIKVRRQWYQSSSAAPESFVAFTTGVVLPLVPSGDLRARVAYTAQARFAGAGGLTPYSGRFVASLTHDIGAALKAYLQFEDTNRAGLSDTTATVGVEYDF